ncbi:hypothetical protein FNT36_04735 [Hymenobacter setariae]|uniref:Uncharacterized protein n=1 Tax=Hymenobacter setariae TaxID=2594794 RepID=A0A558C3P9_9BACT|nr:hypothetical protein [Hymenobacter setariae]TVT43398.1 hypothetical protein FNT36_04735 [Hymenobacter setariae]
MLSQLKTYWTAVANVVANRPYGPNGAETRPASKHFAPGAKVYIIDYFPGTCSRVVVIGLHRKTKRMIKLILAVDFLENFKSKVCYTPAVIALIEAHFASGDITRLTKEFSESLCATLPIWKAEEVKYKTQERPAS